MGKILARQRIHKQALWFFEKERLSCDELMLILPQDSKEEDE